MIMPGVKGCVCANILNEALTSTVSASTVAADTILFLPIIKDGAGVCLCC